MEITGGTAQDIAKAAAQPNPSNVAAKRLAEADYQSMDMPSLKLAVPDLQGYYLYWHLGKNTARALHHGYTFVEPGEVEIPQIGIATGKGIDGSTDLGTRISVSAGDAGTGQEERLYLMKLPLALHQKGMDQKTARNEEIAVKLRAGMAGAEADPDKNKRYMKEGQHLFYPKAPRR